LSWVERGTPAERCDSPTGRDPLYVDAICSSGQRWTLGEAGSSDMHPGRDCIQCHSQRKGPELLVAGTVYATGHEPNDCNGGPQGQTVGIAQVILRGSDGQELTLAVRPSGNFYERVGKATVALPYTARVVYRGQERRMNGPQTDGDCNRCHTETDAEGAPGRITLPE
jgi:hypothetical protein